MIKIAKLLCGLALIFTLVAPLPAQAADVPTISTLDVLQQVADHSGKVVLLNFFASWCPPCKREIPSLMILREELSADDFVLIGISIDEDPQEMQSFVDSVGFNYPIFHATDDVVYLFQVDSIPFNVIYDRDGNVRYARAGLIPESRLRSILDTLLE